MQLQYEKNLINQGKMKQQEENHREEMKNKMIL